MGINYEKFHNAALQQSMNINEKSDLLERLKSHQSKDRKLILSIDTSSKNCSVSLSKDGVLISFSINKKLDKDRFRQDLGGLVDAYQEVARRLGIFSSNGHDGKKGPVLVS